MNSRQLQEAYQRNVDQIQKKVSLGELSQDEGDFLIKQAKARADQEIARLKRPSRIIFYVLAVVLATVFVVCFFSIYRDLDTYGLSKIYLYIMGGVSLSFLFIYQGEVKRLESSFQKYFSKNYFKRILFAPRIDFEWRKTALIQIHLEIKNESNLYAGLKDEEVCELKSHILDALADAFDDGRGIIEVMGENEYIIDYSAVHEKEDVLMVIRKIEGFFANLRSHDGEWYSKSVRMGAGVVRGQFWLGNVGHSVQMFRTEGKKRMVAQALASAAGWEEIYMDEDTIEDTDKSIYVQSQEPIFLKTSKDLIRVFRFSGWKEGRDD